MPRNIRYNNLLSAFVAIVGATTLNGISPEWVKAIFITLAVIALILSIEPVTPAKPN